MVILYAFIDQEKHQYLSDKYSAICSKQFMEKIQKYSRWQDAQLSLLGRILLKYGLLHYFDINSGEVSITSNHKPYLKNHNIHFNISHAHNIVACCISRFPIGIDIEHLDFQLCYDDFKFQMTQREFEKIHFSQDKIRSFFTYWTEKESVIKAHGKGLLIPLQSFEVFESQTVIENEKYYLREIFIHDEYQCSMASVRDIRQQQIHLEQLSLNTL